MRKESSRDAATESPISNIPPLTDEEMVKIHPWLDEIIQSGIMQLRFVVLDDLLRNAIGNRPGLDWGPFGKKEKKQ